MLYLSRCTGQSNTAFVWLPATQKFGVIQSEAFVQELDAFCTNPLSPTLYRVKEINKRLLCTLRNWESPSAIPSLRVTWNNRIFSNSLYHLIPRSSYVSETYLLHYAKTLDTMGYTRMHEISDMLGLDGIVKLLNVSAPFPGKRPHILKEGYFVACPSDPTCVELISIKSRLVIKLQFAAIVNRLLRGHGNSERPQVFRMEMRDGRWFLKGLNPMVPSSNPEPRPFSAKHPQLLVERTPHGNSLYETIAMIPDATEMLRKASQGSSTTISSGPKAGIGEVSLKTSLPYDPSSALQMKIIKEMKVNAKIMNTFRYHLQTSNFFGHILSRLHLALGTTQAQSMHLESRYKRNSSFEVCNLNPPSFNNFINTV